MNPPQPDITSHKNRPPVPRTARLRLVFGYLVFLLAFVVNARTLAALPPDLSVAETLRQAFAWWALVLMAAGMLIRLWSAGTLLKITELATDGPYALSRNPLYLGSFVAGVGLCAFVHSLPLLLLFVVSFAATYRAQIRWEEDYLTRIHPKAFPEYVRRVASFVPMRWNADALRGDFSALRLLRNKEMAHQLFWLVMLLGLMAQAYLHSEGVGICLP